MAYQALYRQWRPKNFSEMVGQEAIVETLRHQVAAGRIAHAYLFCGSRGTGKTSTAKIMARAINCQHPQDGDPCGECEICRQTMSDTVMDIVEFDAASNSKVEDARELLEKVNFPPQVCRYKVYIIDEVHMLSNSAFNALLKTLEEPPEYLVFILATTEPHKLPTTILSRCQRFDFGRIPAAQIQGRLQQAVEGTGGEATPGALMSIARAAEGGMRDALSILDMCLGYGQKVDEALVQQVLGTSDRGFLFRFSHALKEENAAETVRLIDELITRGKDPKIFAKDVGAHLRALILAKCCEGDLAGMMEMTDEDAEDYRRESEDYTTSRLMQMLDEFLKLEASLLYSASPRIALENVSLKCCLRTREVDNLAVNDRIAELEGKISLLEDQLAKGVVVTAQSQPAAPPSAEGKATPASRRTRKESAPAEKKAPAPSGLSPDQVWQEMQQRMKKEEASINGFLMCGKFVGKEGTEYRWKEDQGLGGGIYTSILNDPSRKGRIEAVLTEIAGEPCTFAAVDSGEEARKRQEASDEAYEDSLRETFGAGGVQVLDDLPPQT